MLKKLLKYDFKATFRIWRLFLVILPAVALSAGLVYRFVATTMDHDKLVAFSILGIFYLVLCYLALVASMVLVPILVFVRLYKNFFTDEGYLTFTLPVRRSDLLLSKTLNAVIFTLLHGLLYLVCFLIIGIIAPPSEGRGIFNPVVFEEIADLWFGLQRMIGDWIYLYAAEALLCLLVSVVFSITMIHFSMTLASTSVKRGKVILGIGIYYGASNVWTFLLQMFVVLGSWLSSDGIALIVDRMSNNEIYGAIALILLMFCAATAAITTLLYCVTLQRLERKLNLS